MRQITTKDLNKILVLHKLWIKDHFKGKKADLSEANLSGAYLSGADLSEACLYRANLSGANLSGANLSGADLYETNLSVANLRRANLHKADLSEACLYRANLLGANLLVADLSGADLHRAYLHKANLSGANLRRANLSEANISEANLSETNLPCFLTVPKEGSFIGWKATTMGVIKLLIPEDSKRISTLVSRKCRASKVLVLDGEGCGGTGPIYPTITYNKGEVIESNFSDDIREECAEGIHFFMTKKEAEEWK